MSTRAITWAMERTGLRSSTKFVLVALANYANEQHEAYPSVAAIESDTCQDRKTVLANLRRLVDDGFLHDTGRRVGSTAQVIVYRLAVGVDVVSGKGSENGTVMSADAARTTDAHDVGVGAVESPQTVPKTGPLNSTVFPVKESQFSAETVPFFRETVPKTGHVYVRNHKEPLPPLPPGGGCAASADGGRGGLLPAGWGYDPDGQGGMTAEIVAEAKRLKDELGVDWGLQRLRFELDEFHDYWHSVPAAKGRRRNWLATWRNRCRLRMAQQPSADPVRRDRQAAAARDARRLGA